MCMLRTHFPAAVWQEWSMARILSWAHSWEMREQLQVQILAMGHSMSHIEYSSILTSFMVHFSVFFPYLLASTTVKTELQVDVLWLYFLLFLGLLLGWSGVIQAMHDNLHLHRRQGRVVEEVRLYNVGEWKMFLILQIRYLTTLEMSEDFIVQDQVFRPKM